MLKRFSLLFVLNFFVASSALGIQLDDRWLAKYPTPSSITIYPWFPLSVAQNFIACSEPKDVPTRLWQALDEISKSHYLDDFSKEVKILNSFSASGDHVAKLFLALMWTDGTLESVDDNLANGLIEEITNTENLFVLSQLHSIKHQLAERLLLDKKGITALMYSRLSSANERDPRNTFIAENLGELYAFDEDVDFNVERALALLESSLTSCPQNAWAQNHLASYLLVTKAQEPSTPDRAMKLMNAASSSGNVSAIYLQANSHFQEGSAFYAIALSLYEKAASKGHAHAAFSAGNMYLRGDGAQADIALSAKYFKLAAHLGDQEALLLYAEILRDGIGHPPDPLASLEYFEAALQPDNNIWLEIPQTYELMGDKDSLEQAKNIYEGALKKRSSDAGMLQLKNRAQAKTGLLRVTQKLRSLQPSLGAETLDEEALITNVAEKIEFGNFYALLIGNENYSNLKPLKSAIEDATDISKVLQNTYGFQTELLIDATRAQILKKLNEYRFNLGEKDNFLLFYAGHGIYDEQTEEGFWQPIDASSTDENWISNDRITTTLRGFTSQNIMVVADSCYSGVVFRSGSATANNHSNKLLSTEYIRSMLEQKTRIAITSGGMEPVVDSLPGSRNSVFSGVFIEKLKQSKGIITAQALFMSVSEEVVTSAANMGLEQTPGYAGIRRSGHDGGDFLFVPKEK